MQAHVQVTEQSLASRITELVQADAVQLPPLPEVVLKARQLMASETSSGEALARLLSQDAAIVASLMRVANSAAFGGLGRLDSLHSAIQRIGMRQVGAIVVGLGLKAHFHHENPAKSHLLSVMWDHAVTSAFAARALARRAGLEQERAFLAGLLHDCGKVLVLAALDALESRGEVGEVSSAATRELMNALHCDLGHRVLQSWNLPDDVARVALLHHRRMRSGEDLVLCVQVANLITRRLGFHLDPDPDLSVVGDPVIEALGLSDVQVATLMVDMEEHLDEMRRLL